METSGCLKKCTKCSAYVWEDEHKETFEQAVFQKYKGIRSLLKIRKIQKPKSEQQRGYWFGVVVAIYSDYTGLPTLEAHHEIMKELRPREEIGKDGKSRIKPTSYEDFGSMDTELLHEDGRNFVSEASGRYVPLPNEPWGEYSTNG